MIIYLLRAKDVTLKVVSIPILARYSVQNGRILDISEPEQVPR